MMRSDGDFDIKFYIFHVRGETPIYLKVDTLDMLKRGRLTPHHEALGARMVQFVEWEVPLYYSSISEEHLAVRNAAGLFDVSHMGEIVVSGPGALPLLQHALTGNIASLAEAASKYSTACNDSGGIEDDLLVYHLKGDAYMMVTNAANTKKIHDLLASTDSNFGAQTKDITDSTTMLSLQGPLCQNIISSVLARDLSKVKWFKGLFVQMEGSEVLVSRTGYTGEDGFELYIFNDRTNVPNSSAAIWDKIMNAGRGLGLRVCGLGARDTLRLEAGYLLYGNDIDASTSPLEARIDFVVDFSKEDFVGKAALLKQKSEGLTKVRIGFRSRMQKVPRKGCRLLSGPDEAGVVTSGTVSPLTHDAIGMGYVGPEFSDLGGELQVEIRGEPHGCTVCSWPFYDSSSHGRDRKILP